AGRVRIEVAPDKPVLEHAALQLSDAVARRYASALRQHADPDEIAREQRADPVDQLVAGGGPGFGRRRIAQMMSHPGRARREDREIGATLLLHLQLAVNDAGADFVVADRRPRWGRPAFTMRGDLIGAPRFMLAWRCGVVAMTVDDHDEVLRIGSLDAR